MRAFTTARPVTYCIDYGGMGGHLPDPERILKDIRSAPPHLMHLGHDVPFQNSYGPIELLEDGRSKLLSPEEVGERMQAIRAFLSTFREAGCKKLIPYVCNQTLAGDPDKRLGIWQFYDHWDAYARYDVGPRPEKDPIDWLAREPNGRLHYNYENRHEGFRRCGMLRWAPCCNNPYYNQFQCLIVKHIARIGYDGVFVDNNNLNCYCTHCQEKFRAYLANRYSPRQLRGLFQVNDAAELSLAQRGSRLLWVKQDARFREFLRDLLSNEEIERWFGTSSLDEALLEEAGNGWLWGRAHDYRVWLEQKYSPKKLEELLGFSEASQWGLKTPAERLLWAETKRFWADSVRQNLELLRNTGRAERGGFFITPNWGNMEEPDATEFREEIGHIAEIWSPGMDFMMFEEGNLAGAVAPGLYVDHILQYKFALAAGFRAAVLPYGNWYEGTTDLGNAENVAQGGFAYIQGGVGFPEIRQKWTCFLDRYGDLLADSRSMAEVAVLYSFDELVLENGQHQTWVQHLTRYLSEQQVLFSLVTPAQLADNGREACRVLVIPGVRYMAKKEVASVADFAEAGGTVVLVGETGTHDEFARPRKRSALGGLMRSARRVEPGLAVSKDGRVIVAANPEWLIGPYRVSREDALQFATYSQASINVPSGSAGLVYELDRMVGIDRYQAPANLVQRLEEALGHPLRLADPYEAQGVRFTAFRHDVKTLLLHMVNYNVSLIPRGATSVQPVHELAVRAPVDGDWSGAKATLLEPGCGPESLELHHHPGAISFTLPKLWIYKLAVIEAR